MSRKRIFFYFLLSLLTIGFTYLYIWEKPKLEKLVENYIEKMSADKDIPFKIEVGRTNVSIIPLQLELIDTEFKPKSKLSNTLQPFKVAKVALRPSLIDLLVGKFWISLLSIEDTDLTVKVVDELETDSSDLNFNFNNILKRIPISQISVQNVRLKLNYQNKYFVTTESLYLKAYNEKSSLILTIKDPNLGLKTRKSGEYLQFLADFQVMMTKNTISLSKIKVVKDTSFFLASGNILYDGAFDNFTEVNVKTRINSKFSDLKIWSNVLKENNYFDNISGIVKSDVELAQKGKGKQPTAKITGELLKLKIGKILIGDIAVNANVLNEKQINIPQINATLSGENLVTISDAKVHIGETTEIAANVEVKNAQLHSFLRDSGIADIPVWLRVSGKLTCNGTYKEHLKIDCPGAMTIKDLAIKNKERTKNIVATKEIDVVGSATVTEKNISYSAQAKLKSTKGESTGIIDFDKGFDIQYSSDLLDFEEIGPIADLKFAGIGKNKGTTKGNSHWATFSMDVEAENFEFENYFFGEIKTELKYKTGSLYFDPISGSIESTRYNGKLEVNLLKELIIGDIQLPFFRMADVQQSILKKVDLQGRFLGSGSGRLQLNTPFAISQLNFALDARLFKGQAFGEEYNEARIKAQSIDGIIIIQESVLQKEQTQFSIKGTLDTDLESKLSFVINDGFLQLSSRLKEMGLPISGQFSASGEIFGQLSKPFIKTKAVISSLFFNKKKYGDGIFSFDNSNKQTNLQFKIPGKLESLFLLPEQDFDSIFVDITANQLDVAPLIGFAVSEEATRSYVIHTSGELSGKFDTKELWNSEFSSTIKNVTFDYKSNKMETTIPTNIELKNGKLFLNEISFIGNRQHIKVTQPYTEKYRTKFVINSRINIAFFKLFAPFIEKVDGYSTLRLELSLNNKDFKLIGSSYTSDSFLKFPGFPHAFENLSADILFNQNKVLINSISAELAGGDVLGNGEITFQEAKKFDLIINTNMENVNINFPDGFKTTGSGNISLSGSEPPFLLSGEYNVEKGLIDSNFDSSSSSNKTDLLEELLKKEVTSPLVINLDINTIKPVEVRNNLVEGYILGNIKVFDKINSPRLKGEAHFNENAIIRFRDQEFEVTSSSFIFEGQTPINPKLSLRSQTRMNGYDINLFLQGRASKPILTWSSQPPLPETQIVSMLALGTLPEQYNRNNTNDQTPNTTLNQSGSQGFEVGTSLLSNNPLGRELKERYNVDVQFSSSFDDQNNTAVPKMTLRKKITKKAQISVSATTGSSNQQEGQATYELNRDLSAIFRIINRADNSNNVNGPQQNRQNNSVGVDVEYRLEFD